MVSLTNGANLRRMVCLEFFQGGVVITSGPDADIKVPPMISAQAVGEVAPAAGTNRTARTQTPPTMLNVHEIVEYACCFRERG
jgi:hypothetical protein